MTGEPSLGTTKPTPPNRAAAVIRSELSELGSQNAAHRFEDLCRQFARKRIAPNIIPATGPVGTGGDQGRDFETFRTYLTAELGEHGAFAGYASSTALAFACTLQVDNVKGKIRTDVTKICAGGVRVETVYAFVTQRVSVSDRHELQEEARAKHDVGLEIFDLLALSEQLADPDIFWIAEEYLSIPAELAPQRADPGHGVPEWYTADRERWEARDDPAPTLGHLLDLRDGLRLAAQTPELSDDLLFWMTKMRGYTASHAPLEVRQRARYEVAVATVYGLRDLRSADELVADFFADLGPESSAASLDNAAVLLSYACTALSYGATTLASTQIDAWAHAAMQLAQDQADASRGPIGRARMLETVGHIGLIPAPAQIDRPDAAHPLPDIVDVKQRMEAGNIVGRTPDMAAWALDVRRAMVAWGELAGLMREWPLVPTAGLSTSVELLAPMLVDQPEWRSIVDALDEAVQRSEGGTAVADRALGRALRLAEADRLVEALSELHRALVASFTGDYLSRALDCMLAIGEAYHRLGLPQAAKQYALGASAIARSSGSPDLLGFVPHGFLNAATYEYRIGNWTSAIELIDLGFKMQDLLVDAEVDQWAESDSERGIHQATLIRAAAADLMDSEFEELITSALLAHGFPQELLDAGTGNTHEVWQQRTDDELRGRPFDDVGSTYVMRFGACGLRFSIECANEFRDVLAAERFAAALQILLVELRDLDLCLVPQETEIAISTYLDGTNAGMLARNKRNATREIGLMTVPIGEPLDPERVTHELLTAAMEVLLDLALVPRSTIVAAIEPVFERGLLNKLLTGRPYDELIPTTQESFDASLRQELESPLDEESRPEIQDHPELAWRDGPGPTYDRTTAGEMLNTRYDQFPVLAGVTLARLNEDGRFARTVVALRERRWLDWHILTAVYNIALGPRVAASGHSLRTATGVEAIKDLMFTPESVDDPRAPIETYLDVATLERALEEARPHLLANWNLEPSGLLDLDGIERVLSERYGYWTDDEPHPDPFARPTNLADIDE